MEPVGAESGGQKKSTRIPTTGGWSVSCPTLISSQSLGEHRVSYTNGALALVQDGNVLSVIFCYGWSGSNPRTSVVGVVVPHLAFRLFRTSLVILSALLIDDADGPLG
eukprot:4655323-Pyramimonas_sp.AAC.1